MAGDACAGDVGGEVEKKREGVVAAMACLVLFFGGDWVRCRRRHPLLKTWGSSTRAACQVLESSSPRFLDDRVELELKLELYYRLLHSLDQLVH